MGEVPVRIPDYLYFEGDTISDIMKEKLREFLNKQTVFEKQTLLQELSKRKGTLDEKKGIIMTIVHIFLWINPKHQIRKTCNRILASSDQTIVQEAMAKQIGNFVKKISDAKTKNKSKSINTFDIELDTLRHCYVVILQGLFGTFPAAVAALNDVLDEVFHFAFYQFIKSFSYIESGQIQLDIAQPIMYDTTRLLDTIVHQCDINDILPPASIELLITSYKAIQHENVTFNTKTHCGALIVIAIVQFPEKIEADELEDVARLLNVPSLEGELNLLPMMLKLCPDCYTTRICIFSGIVQTCPLEIMAEYATDDGPVSYYLFQQMLAMGILRSSIAPEIIEISRTLVTLSPVLSDIKTESFADTMKACWDYIWMHLDHFVDTVRSDAQKLLKTVITATLDLTNRSAPDASNPYLQMFTSAISEIIQGRNSNIKALAHIACAMKVQVLLEIFPKLPESLLKALDNPSVAQAVCATYEKLMEQHTKEAPEQWVDHWVIPLIPLKQAETTLPYILKIFNTAFKLNPSVLTLIVSPTLSDAEYRAFLSCILTARKNNIKLEFMVTPMNGNAQNGTNMFSKKHLQLLISHQSAEIRILVLTLLVECQRSTELFTSEDFKLLVRFFRYNASTPFPNFRQNMVALYKKAFNRFKDSFYVIQRSIRNEEARGDAGDAAKLSSLVDAEALYKEFIMTFFRQHLICGLFNYVEYSKRAICLELILHMKTCVPEELYKSQWSPEFVPMLYSAFEDTYETNLVMLKKLLLGLPQDVVFNKSNMKALLEILVRPFAQIGRDVKSNVTTSATYAILVHLNAPYASELIKKAYGIKDNAEASPIMLFYKQLSKQIDAALQLAKKNSNKYVPVYGVLYVIRHLISEQHIDTEHPEILSKLVAQCIDIVKLAMPVVNSSAPEGYNSNNMDYAQADVTPQLVLHYAWRTIKEVSLLFGNIDINDGKVMEVFVKEGIMKKIAHYFIELFESAKHRGAYEQGYVGFSKLTEQLWNCDNEWNKLPQQWLEDALQLITSTDAKLCATRRSAGIPFLIQGILVTEPKHRANQSFHHCMQRLLKVAEDYSKENQTSAIHSMNILRALYRHNQFGEVVAVYVSQGVMISITQFSHVEWAIRNSATLMFSALMMRMFGVQRLKDSEEISIKNRLPLKVFQARYPDLYKFLFEKLEEYVQEEKENVSLYPILVILARVYLTFDTPRDDKLEKHLDIIIKSTTRNIYKIRELAVTATVTYETFLYRKHQGENQTNNQIHANLLRLQQLMRCPKSENKKLMLYYFKPLFVLITETGKGISQTCTTLLMDILIEFLKSHSNEEQDLNTYTELLKILHEKHETTLSTCARYQQTRFCLYLHVILKIPHGQWYTRAFIASALMTALASKNEDLNIFALNCIRYISNEKLEKPEERELEYEFVESLSTQSKVLLQHIIKFLLIKQRTFMDLFDILRNRSRTYALRVCQVLYNYPSIVYTIRPLVVPVRLSHQMILDYLDRQATSICPEMFVAIMGLISKFVAGSNELFDLEFLIDHLVEFVGDGSTVDERLAVANFLLKNIGLLTNTDELPEDLRLKLWYIYLDLIQDDEYSIREFCTHISNGVLDVLAPNQSNARFGKNCPQLPERLHEEVLAELDYFVGMNEALKIYVKLSLDPGVSVEKADDGNIYDKQRASNFKESRPYASQARHFLACYLWKLGPHLSYENKTIFIEEHFLLVVTRLLNILICQEKTYDRFLCVAVLNMFAQDLETAHVGAATVENILGKFEFAFTNVEAVQCATDKSMRACNAEVNQFLSYVLFTRPMSPTREDVGECKCDTF